MAYCDGSVHFIEYDVTAASGIASAGETMTKTTAAVRID